MGTTTIFKESSYVNKDGTVVSKGGGSGSCDLSNYYTKTELATYNGAKIHYTNIFYDGKIYGSSVEGAATVSGYLGMYSLGRLRSIVNGNSTTSGIVVQPSVVGEIYTFDDSIIADSNNIVTLVNDEDAPGALRLYGTDALGVKGWQPQPDVDSSGLVGECYYTNLNPLEVAHGGATVGMTFTNQTMQQMFDCILFPYQSPTFSSFSMSGLTSVLECGVYFTGGSHTFSWGTTSSGNVQPNTIQIRDVTNAVNLATGLANDGTEVLDIGSDITKTSTGVSHTWNISGTNTHSGAITPRTTSITWYSPFYYGVGAPDLTVAQVQALTKSVSGFGDKAYQFSPVSQVYYFAFPAAYGELISILDTNGFETIADWTLRTEDFTNNPTNYNGITVAYYVYEFNNLTTQTNFWNRFYF